MNASARAIAHRECLSVGCLRIWFSLNEKPHQILFAVVMTLSVSQHLLAASWPLMRYMVRSVVVNGKPIMELQISMHLKRKDN